MPDVSSEETDEEDVDDEDGKIEEQPSVVERRNLRRPFRLLWSGKGTSLASLKRDSPREILYRPNCMH